MPIVPAQQLLKAAKEEKYALAGFDVFNLETLEAVVSTCEKLASPVLVQTSFFNFDYYRRELVFHMVKSVLECTTIPAVFHLDHGPREMSFEEVSECLKLGYPSVMFDGSHLPLEKNIALTKKIVKMAQSFGAAVEGQVGCVGRNPNASAEAIKALMTDPEEASRFVRETGVDSLAVSVGSISGCFDEKKVNLDLERLAQIAAKTSLPLVFHGGTGIPDGQVREAIKIGVSKINVAHGVRKAFVGALRGELGAGPNYKDPRPVMAEAKKRIEEYTIKKLELFGSIGQAR